MSVDQQTTLPPRIPAEAVRGERVVVAGLWAQVAGLLALWLFTGGAWGFVAAAAVFAGGISAGTSFVPPTSAGRRAAPASAWSLVAVALVTAAVASPETYALLGPLLWAPVVAAMAWQSGLWRDRLQDSAPPAAARWERLRVRSIVLGHVLVLSAVIVTAIGPSTGAGEGPMLPALRLALLASSLFLLVWGLDALGVLAMTSRAAPSLARPPTAVKACLALAVLLVLVANFWMSPAGATLTSRTLVDATSLVCDLEYDPPLFAATSKTVDVHVGEGPQTVRLGAFDVTLSLDRDGDAVYYEQVLGARGLGTSSRGIGDYSFQAEALGFGTLIGRCDPA